MGLLQPSSAAAPAWARCIADIEAYLASFVERAQLPPNLGDAVRYALLGGGKRLRPVLVWHSCVATGGKGPESLAAAAAVELVHAFSLVHDDLPAMDDDDLRRGRPTLHVHAGEAMAILAGDEMLTLAFMAIAAGVRDGTLAAALVRELAAATSSMIRGQVYDTLGGVEGPEAQRLETVHKNKTGALIRAACRMGAMSARAGDEALEAITKFAEAMGLMFQIVDDLMDVELSPEQTGKRTRKDAAAGKLTYPGVFGVSASRLEVDRLRAGATEALQGLGPAAGPLRELCGVLATRDR